MDANETFDTFMRELNNRVICDTDGADEQDPDDDVPHSLLRYLETSRSRAAVCEKLILEELGDLPASHPTEDTMDFPFEVDEDTRSPNEQVVCDTEDEENNTSDARLPPAPTETEAPFTHYVPVCPNNEDEQKHVVSEEEAERQKRRCDEMKEEELKRQVERDFQTQLKKMMEAEKLHQEELELMGRRAQEKLDQELLLQQELMSDLQRRVQEERRMREEEQKRMKDEEDKRTREEEKIKIEAERKGMEEEMRRLKEEERRIEEMELKKEEERKREQEEKRRVEREEKRKREEEKTKIEMKKRKLEEEMRVKKEEEKRKREEEKIKIEAERKEMEEEMRRKKEEARRIEEMELKKEEERKREQEEKRRVEREEKRKREEEKTKIEMDKRKLEEMRMMKESEEREKKEEEEKRKREVERNNIEEEAKKKVEKEKRKMEEDIRQKKEEERKKREEENRKIEEEVRITKKIEERKKQEETRKNKEEEEALKKVHVEMKKRDEKEQSPLSELRKKEEEDRKTKEEPRPIEEDEKREDERKTKEEERRRTKEDLRREDEEGHRKAEAEIKLEEDEEGHKRYEVDNRKMEHESKTKEKKHEEEEKEEEEEEEEEEGNVEAEKELKEEEEGQHKKEEEITLKEKEESKKRGVVDRENEGMRANEPNDKIENNSTSSSIEVKPQQHDPHLKVGPTSTEGAAGPTEERRLAWMQDCVRWAELSLQNRSKQRGSSRGTRGPRGSAGSGGPAPLCPDALLRSTGCKSLQEVTSVTLEDLPGRGSSTLALCTQLRSLTLRRCGLRSLEGLNQLPQLCHIDVQENEISFVDCENMSSLRVLRLGHNKLTSIHGLSGAEQLDVLDLSHNSITRIAGLESMRRLQRLSVDHNQLISTRGLGCVYTLLHLSCSHNHLASVEGLESSALLNTLDLSANSLAEPPSLSNQVLLRELHLDDNNISSLHGLAACWLPLMQHLSVAQNRITQLPPMADSVSLANLDLRFNCMSELQNVCESLEGCVFLREVHLEGNPLQQERGWRAALQRAAPGLRAVDGRQTDSGPTPAAAGRVGPASGSFLAFCQAQLQQTRDLQRQHSRELSGASSSLDAVTTSCRHLAEVLQLAVDHRFAHEHGDATVAAGRRTPGEMDGAAAERQEAESAGKVQRSTGPKTRPTASEAASGRVHSSATKRKTASSNLESAPVSSNQHLDLQNTAAAVVIQQLWRKYRQKCGNISSLSATDRGGGRGGRGGRGGDGGKPESGPSYVNGSVVGPDYAATVIQASWRGFALRRRLAAAAAASRPDAGEEEEEDDDEDAFEFEEVDVDEFVFDEKRWTLSLSEDSPPGRCPASEPPLKPPEPSQCFLPPPLVWRPKQAWLPGGQVDSAGRTGSPETSNRTLNDFRSKSPASSSVPSRLSQRSEKILEEWGFTDSHTALLMLKRAQKMKPTTQRQRKRRDLSVRPAFRSCSYPLAPVESRNRPVQHNRSDMNGGEAEPERVKRLRTRDAHPDSDSESVHFLPEISSDVLNGGRVQLVADPACTHHGSGSHSYPRRNSYGPSSGEVPSPRRVASAPSKRERISHRDKAVQLSGGWGGGKKRDKEYK